MSANAAPRLLFAPDFGVFGVSGDVFRLARGWIRISGASFPRAASGARLGNVEHTSNVFSGAGDQRGPMARLSLRPTCHGYERIRGYLSTGTCLGAVSRDFLPAVAFSPCVSLRWNCVGSLPDPGLQLRGQLIGSINKCRTAGYVAIVQHRGNQGVGRGLWRGYGLRPRDAAAFRGEHNSGEPHPRAEGPAYREFAATAGGQHAGRGFGKGMWGTEKSMCRTCSQPAQGRCSGTLIPSVVNVTAAMLRQPTGATAHAGPLGSRRDDTTRVISPLLRQWTGSRRWATMARSGD